MTNLLLQAMHQLLLKVSEAKRGEPRVMYVLGVPKKLNLKNGIVPNEGNWVRSDNYNLIYIII